MPSMTGYHKWNVHKAEKIIRNSDLSPYRWNTSRQKSSLFELLRPLSFLKPRAYCKIQRIGWSIAFYGRRFSLRCRTVQKLASIQKWAFVHSNQSMHHEGILQKVFRYEKTFWQKNANSRWTLLLITFRLFCSYYSPREELSYCMPREQK